MFNLPILEKKLFFFNEILGGFNVEIEVLYQERQNASAIKGLNNPFICF